MAVTVVALLVGVGTLTGRRKVIIQLAVFVSTYFILWAIFEKRVGKLAIIALTTAALAVYALLAAEVKDDVMERRSVQAVDYSLFVERSQNAFQYVPRRFLELGIAPVLWAYDNFGLFGAGLGVGTQGTQHFGGGMEGAGAAEGGLGKIMLELGVVGLVVMGWVGILGLRYTWRIMGVASRRSPRIGRLSFGFFSFLVANVASFSIATQVYGDLLILLILGWTLGFLLAVPLFLEREVRARHGRTFQELPPVFQPNTI